MGYAGKLISGSVALVGHKVKQIMGNISVTDTATAKGINGAYCTVIVIEGNVWINPLATAKADSTAIKVIDSISLVVDGNLSLISDESGATVQIIIWE